MWVSSRCLPSPLADEPPISDTSIDAEIPSYPGSPELQNYSMTAAVTSIISFYEQFTNENEVVLPINNDLTQAIDFLHRDDPILLAAELGDLTRLETYIKRGENIHAMDHLGRNALHLSVCTGNRRIVLTLLKAGVKPNIKDSLGMTPLMLCLMRSPSWRMANMLFDYGARIIPRSNPMDTGLFIQFVIMCTPTKEEEKILRLLVEKGCPINDPEAPGGRQALHFAAMSNNCKLISVLLDLGADAFQKNHRNETPKQVAITFKCKEAYILLKEWELSLLSPKLDAKSVTST